MTAALRLVPLGAMAGTPPVSLPPGAVLVFGRSESADVVLPDPTVSRRHARVRAFDGRIEVEDLESRHGIYVNNHRQTAATLGPGDHLRLGNHEFAVEDSSVPFEAPASDKTILRLPATGGPGDRLDRVALEALLAGSRELMAAGDVSRLLDRVLDRLALVMQADRTAILRREPDGSLVPRAVRPAGAYHSVSDFASAGVVREVIDRSEVLVALDARADPRLRDRESIVGAHVRSVICAPLLGQRGVMGALYADRLGQDAAFTPAQVEYARAFAAHAAVALETAELYAERQQMFQATIEAFARAIDARDPYTQGHSARVSAGTMVLAGVTGLPAEERETMRRSALLHDLGKVGVADRVLLKPSHLDEDERRLMEAHPVIGHRMLAPLVFLAESLPGVRHHHERWDGKGYPDRLDGQGIPWHARLMAVADAYDAMTSTRAYRLALPHEEAARRIRESSGTQFDPAVVAAFDAAEEEFRQMREAGGPASPLVTQADPASSPE